MSYYPQMYQPYNQYGQFQNQPQLQNQSNIQSGNLISVHNEEEAKMYPVAPGNSVTFKDENQPYIYTKTMGFSQLDRPVFERYKLIKEEQPVQPMVTTPQEKYALKDDLTSLMNKVLDLQEEIFALKGDNRKRTEGTGDVEC